MTPELIFSCGTGGVGKTTCSVLLGVALAYQGKKVIIVTIDPARRLADSLKISLEANDISAVPLSNCAGSLEAMMLDASVIFQSVSQENTTVEEFKELSHNRYFTFARDKMSGMQEYMAILQVMTFVRSQKYDAIIVDTPPARNAIEFLEAPKRLENLFSSKGLQWLSSASGLGGISISKTFVGKGLRRFLGSEIITDMTDFFSLFQKVARQLEKASQECTQFMQSSQTKFWIITTPEQQKPDELLAFIDYVKERDFQLAGLILNKYPNKLASLTQKQEDILKKNKKLSETIYWISERAQKERERAEQQAQQLNIEHTKKFYLPKQNLHQLDDVIKLALDLKKQLQNKPVAP